MLSVTGQGIPPRTGAVHNPPVPTKPRNLPEPYRAEHRSRLRQWLGAIVVLAALTVGCAPNPSATPKPAPSTASEDTSRRACHELSAANPNDDTDIEFDPLTWRATAQAAKTANDPGISAAGAKLHGVVAANEQLSKEARVGEPNLALASALISLGNVCGNLYGDGPW